MSPRHPSRPAGARKPTSAAIGDEDQPAARLKRSGMAEGEEVDQAKRATRTTGGCAQHRDQHDAPQVGDARQPDAATMTAERDQKAASREQGRDRDRSRAGGRAHVRQQHRRRDERRAHDVERGGDGHRRTRFAGARLPFYVSARSPFSQRHAGATVLLAISDRRRRGRDWSPRRRSLPRNGFRDHGAEFLDWAAGEFAFARILLRTVAIATALRGVSEDTNAPASEPFDQWRVSVAPARSASGSSLAR